MENATLSSWSDPIELVEIFQLKMNWSLVRVKQELSCERSHLSCFNLDPNPRQAALPFDWDVESAARSSEPKESCGPLGPDRKSFSVAKVPPVNLNKSAAIRNFGSKEGATCEEAHGCNFPPIVMSWRWLSITHWADIFGCKCDITKLAINSYPLRNIRIRRYYAQQKLVCLDVFLYWERPARHCWNGKILLADDIFVRSAPKIGRGKYRIYFYTSNYFITIETSWVRFCFSRWLILTESIDLATTGSDVITRTGHPPRSPMTAVRAVTWWEQWPLPVSDVVGSVAVPFSLFGCLICGIVCELQVWEWVLKLWQKIWVTLGSS